MQIITISCGSQSYGQEFAKNLAAKLDYLCSGDIIVDSKIDEGTTFTVHLPIVSIPADIESKHSRKR